MQARQLFAGFLMLWALNTASLAGNYIRVSPDLELYYEEAGSGNPVIFITGWTGTNEFFNPHQIPYFSKKYRVLAYDPRSQGRSGKTLANNTYTQHGHDLRAFMTALNAKNVAIVAWSWGCHDAYAYFRAYGTDNVRSFVCIDQPPRSIPAQKGDWADYAEFSEIGGFINGLAYDRRATMREFIPTMMQRKMATEEVEWALDQSLKTPDYVASLLAADGTFADYTEEAKKIDGKIPVLNILGEARADAAKAWLAKNAPHSQTLVLGQHMMFREFPGRFNTALDKFLAK
ncbi:MAG: alpha/beta fold hydrolase [Burkholderiales bacterium]